MSAQPPPSPARTLLDGALGSLGKVVAAAAGAGLFLYLIGAAVLWQRVEAVHLQAQEIVAAIPRDQLAVAGAREALASLIAGVLFSVFLYVCYRLYRASQQVVETDGIRGRLARWMRERPAVVVTVAVAIVYGPFLPLDNSSALFFALFLLNLYLGARSAHRSLIGELRDFRSSLVPWLRVAAGLSIAVFIASVWRPSQFPDRFPSATVTLQESTIAGRARNPPADRVVCGQYLGSTSDAVILAAENPPAPPGADRLCPTPGKAAAAIIVARDEIEQITLTRQLPPRPARSLVRRLKVLQLDCILPICQWKKERRSSLTPFADGEKTVEADDR